MFILKIVASTKLSHHEPVRRSPRRNSSLGTACGHVAEVDSFMENLVSVACCILRSVQYMSSGLYPLVI